MFDGRLAIAIGTAWNGYQISLSLCVEWVPNISFFVGISMIIISNILPQTSACHIEARCVARHRV